MLPLHDEGRLANAVDKGVISRLRRPHTLHQLLADGWAVTEVFTQDEFTHDVVIAVDSDLYAVFDST